jgi:hypothetical protein
MGEIPDEVRVALAKDYVRENFESGEPWSMTIARAILAERQRCADAADREAKVCKASGLPLAALGCITVLKAILNPT